MARTGTMAPLTVVAALGVLLAGWLLPRATGAPRQAATRRRISRLGSARARRHVAVAATVRRWHTRPTDRRRLVDGLPVLLEDVARGVRSGVSLRQACVEATASGGPATTGLAGAVADAERGQPLADACTRWATTAATPEERLAAGALALAAAAGGPQARAVDGVAATLRERRAVAAEIRAHSAQARLSAVVIGALPGAFLLWALATDRRTAAFLVAGPAGWACLGAGLGLELTGAIWMRRLLRGAGP
jgi:tight adherence protein B